MNESMPADSQDHVAARTLWSAATGPDEPTVVKVGDVTADFFSVLGVAPLRGRTFLPADGEQGAAPVAVLSYDLWRSRFGADPGLIGRTIDLDKRPFTVVGVMPGNFRFSLDGRGGQLWIQVLQDPARHVAMKRAAFAAQSQVSIERTVNDTLAFYQRALSRPPLVNSTV